MMERQIRQAQPAATQSPPSPDYGLLLQRLEKLVVHEADLERAAELLGNAKVWQRLAPEQALQWATLAEIAGLPDLSLQVLGHLTDTRPDCRAAWQKRVELLETLGRNQREGDGTADPGARPTGSGTASGCTGGAAGVPAGEAEVDAPFVAMRRRERQLDRFLSLFRGREDCFARQWADRKKGSQGYVPVRRAMQASDLVDHLEGRKTYGIYLLQTDSRTRTAVLDADLRKKFRSGSVNASDRDLLRREKRYLVTRLPELCRDRALPCLVEFSGGKGFHFWFLFAAPVAAAAARQVLSRVAKQLEPDLSCFSLEVFPKQDRLAGNGLGNLVKLPLGVHRATGKRSFFLHCRDRSPWAQLSILDQVPLIEPEVLEAAPDAAGAAEVMVHPRHQEWAGKYPELAVLSDRCLALAQIISDCRQARSLSVREEKILLQTLGFLPRRRTLLHHLHRNLPDYNAHLVDYRLSRVRGTPLGCRRIHSLLNLSGDLCRFASADPYPHPLLHWPDWQPDRCAQKAARVTNLQDALEQLKHAVGLVEHFLHP